LQAGEYAVVEQADATKLRARVAEQAFDSHAVTAAEQATRELERWDGEHQALAQAQTRRPEDEAALARAQARVGESDGELARVAEQRTAIEGQLAELGTYRAQQTAVESEAKEAGKARDALQERRGSLAHQLEEIATAEVALKEAEAGRKDLVEESSAYGELALAFGKGGVQALLIEAAIPRLEDEANALLKQMTDGRMSLKLETQRARRTGRGADGSDSVETLDIVIADELGTRNYDMFSGGERFRVDFALRIALSKLLAWRAGAPLPTLFIDEGFGTQDAEGRDRILDVIKAIEDRFERILVITHLDEVKEAFPVRIEVTRGNAGSTFSLS
jgi:exonuclease SbcC